MANFSDLPTEIQHLIARDLPRSDLLRLKSLSSLFLNQWMDTRWKSVIVDLKIPGSVVCLLQRVVDPFVATRLKMLTINLDHSQFFLRTIPPKPEFHTFDSVVTLLLDCLPLLPNITSLTITVSTIPTFVAATFFQRIPSLSFARKLQNLTLSGPVRMLMSLWECSAHNTPFESLTKLNLDLDDNVITQTEFSPSLEHFLRSLAPTLQYLYVSTAIDLSSLFDALAQPLSLSQTHSLVPFPNLISLFLHLSGCFKTSWRDPRSLRRFLVTHDNLQHLYLRTHRASDSQAEKFLGVLLELADYNDQLPSFQTLDIYPPATQAGLSAVLTLIKRSAPTLSSLLLPFRYLTNEEAIRVVDALTEDEVRVPGMTTTTTQEEQRKLKSLEMRITCLSVPFFDLLARKLPQLETLILWINNIARSDERSFYEQLSQRRYDPNITDSQDILHAWKLQHLSIYWDWNFVTRSKRAERAVMGAVPALACRRYEW